MFLLPFWALKVAAVLLPMQGQKALIFHQKYLNLSVEDERRSCAFGIGLGEKSMHRDSLSNDSESILSLVFNQMCDEAEFALE